MPYRNNALISCQLTNNNHCYNLPTTVVLKQPAKKVMSDSPGLVDFAIGLVMFVLNLPDGQVLFFVEIQITEGL